MASFEWPLDKQSVINSALSQTGDNLVATPDDGSDEWNTCSPAYERALAYMMESHGWSQATDVRTLPPATNKPADDQFDTAYNIPNDMVHLIWVRLSDLPIVWGLLNGQIVVNGQGAVGTTGAVLTAKGVFSTNSDPVFSTPTFVIALVAFVMSGIYRGLHEDVAQAAVMWNSGKALLQEARTLHDQQKPKTAMFNSRISAARRIRRPWPVTPTGWGGSGSPG